MLTEQSTLITGALFMTLRNQFDFFNPLKERTGQKQCISKIESEMIRHIYIQFNR